MNWLTHNVGFVRDVDDVITFISIRYDAYNIFGPKIKIDRHA
jgi:hypothetical protein